MIARFCLAASLALLGLTSLVVDGQNNITEWDVTEGGFRITCDPFPALCAKDGGHNRNVFSLVTSIDPIGTGIVSFEAPSDYFLAQNCKDQSCTIVCDDICTCETGVVNTSPSTPFDPDGGTCPILSEGPGTVPTNAPTPVPTSAPTFNPETSILYNATGMQEPEYIRFSECGGSDSRSFCEVIMGSFSLSIGDEDSFGWSNCGVEDECLISCSPSCQCDVANLGDTSLPGELCTIVDPTPSPSMSPTSSSAPLKTGDSLLGGLLLWALVVFGAFLLY